MGGINDIQMQVTDPVRIATYPPGTTFGPRVLTDHEFVWIVDGEAEWDCDGTIHVAGPGTVILARPGMRDSFQWDPVRQMRHGYFHFRVLRAPGLPPQEDWPSIRHVSESDVLLPLFRYLGWLSETRPPSWEALTAAAARLVLAAFVTGLLSTVQKGYGELPPVVERVLRYVHERWSNDSLRPPTLRELADHACMSPSHLSRVFSKELGYGPIQVLTLMRLDRAATLLARTNLQVQEIARLTGFQSPFHFSRRFHASFGVSPTDYRALAEDGRTPLPPRVGAIRQLSDRARDP